MFIKKLRHCCEFIACLIILNTGITMGVSAQPGIKPEEIKLFDTSDYTSFYVDRIYSDRYPPSNLFDGDFKTCWVNGSEKRKHNSILYFRIPELNDLKMNIFSGYGKTRTLYYQNARPAKIRLTLYAAMNPEGYVTENAILYKAYPFPREQVIVLADSFGIQTASLNLPEKEIATFKRRVYHCYDSASAHPIADTCLIGKLEVLESNAGTKYTDICISEIFFHDRFVSYKPKSYPQIKKVYENLEQNALLLDDTEKRGKVVFRDTSQVVHLMQVSPDKRWAILLTQPAKIQGRVETTYHLVDLVNKEIVNKRIESITGVDVSMGMVFETPDEGNLYLDYYDNRIELK